MPRAGDWKQCEAHSKQTGERCKQPVVPGKRVCHYHGGKSLSGPAAPGWKDGRHSKWLPRNWLERYERAMSDDDLLSLRPEISLIDTQISDALERLQTSESEEVWGRLQREWAGFMAALRAEDKEEQLVRVRALDGIIKVGASASDQRRELNTLLDQRRKTTESAQKVAVAGEKMVMVDVMIAHMALMIGAIKEAALKYADETTAKRIIVAANNSYQELIGPGTGG